MHAPHQPFLERIREHPDEDALRLIYADWLDEQGDPRGEFIRIQCEIAKLSSREIACRHALETREQALLKEFRKQWTSSSVFKPFQIRKAEFQRGFLEQAQLIYQPHPPDAPSRFADRWKNLIEREPALKCVGLFLYHDWNEVKQLGKTPQLRCLHVNHQRLERREVSLLLRWPVIQGLAMLDLSHNNLRSGVECVTQSPHVQTLRELDLSFNRIGTRGTRALVSSPFFRSLEFLNLRGNRFGREGKHKLRQAFGSRVQL